MDPKHYGYNTISEFPSIVPSIYLNPSKLKLWRKPLRSVLKVFLTTYLSIPTENVWLDYILFAQKTLKEIIVFTSWIEKRNAKTGFLQQKYIFQCAQYIWNITHSGTYYYEYRYLSFQYSRRMCFNQYVQNIANLQFRKGSYLVQWSKFVIKLVK